MSAPSPVAIIAWKVVRDWVSGMKTFRMAMSGRDFSKAAMLAGLNKVKDGLSDSAEAAMTSSVFWAPAGISVVIPKAMITLVRISQSRARHPMRQSVLRAVIVMLQA